MSLGKAEELDEKYDTLCVDEARYFIGKHPGKTIKQIALIENLTEISNDE
jgi:hypothetical protein